jgi:hypothetical protein
VGPAAVEPAAIEMSRRPPVYWVNAAGRWMLTVIVALSDA